MIRLNDLEAFVAIVEARGQSAAAHRLGRSLQSVARSLATLESASGVQLIRRNTRRSRPTEAGRASLLRVAPALAEIEAARREAAEVGAEPSGLLRIGSPTAFGAAHVVPAVRAFLERHPRVEVELVTSDRPPDLFEQRQDLAMRIRELPDSSLKVRRLRSIRVDGRFRTDGTTAIHAAVARGLGLGRAPLWQIRSLIEQGTVEPVLEEFESARLPIQVVWPAARQPAAKVRLFVDALARHLKGARL